MVSMQVVRILVGAVADAGVPRASFVRAARLDPAFLQAPDARLSRSRLSELVELALELTGNPALGLHSIERLSNDALGPIGALVVHAATLREAMSSIQEFRRALGDEPSFRVYEGRGTVYVHLNESQDEPANVRRFRAEVVVAGLFRTLVRSRVERHVEVSFDYPAPDHRHDYERIFKGRARFGQAFTGLRFDKSILAAAAPHPDAEFHDALRIFAKRRVASASNNLSYAARVHDCIVWQSPPRDVTMPAIASAIGVSERSLRRHLAAEGRSYVKIVDEALAFVAKTCLLDERRTITETATELGFSDNTCFHRAFKRWTGLTPTDYRRQQMTIIDQVRK